ncbi:MULTISPECIES: hypothetical protein [Corynebacterium]|uniref:putative PDDEXK endonuclease n=1 Tax=Corynebacterium TaxID=1716 RepID=UPI0025513CFC|nr:MULTISPECIES: hypothetical protein [Corynebacterium]MDK8660261.1 hypothetical protein [Corynebacterium sp. MSK204]WKS60298.1 hypothetical protein NLL43_11060 [Corynebacterium accolens]
MSRNRNTAKQAGARFERLIADHLRDNLDDRIDRRVKTGAKDCGDIANVRDSHNRRITIECKDYGGKLNLPQWTKEAHQEADNDNAHVGVVIAKRRGTTDPGKQWAIMEIEDLIKLLKSPGDVL